MATPLFSVCVFCSASESVSDTERAAAAALGRDLAARGWRLVYGGGNVGLMGEVARAALGAGGYVLGVIPHRLAVREIALEEVTELIKTDTMRERKAHMDAQSDAFLVLTGGIGTLEELIEILTLKQLGYHDRPIVLLDPEDYWGPLLAQLERMVERDLASESLWDLFSVARDAEHALSLTQVPTAEHHAGAREELEAVEDPSA